MKYELSYLEHFWIYWAFNKNEEKQFVTCVNTTYVFYSARVAFIVSAINEQ
jgi:hypothetical protein